MAWFPISHTVPQYVDGNGDPYSGAVLKAYSAGTTTNISMATDSSGNTTVSSVELDSKGYPSVSGNVVIPHLNEKYKLALYPTQAAADADSSPEWIPDNIKISGEFGSATQIISTTTILDSSDIYNNFEATGNITVTLPDISDVGSGFVFTIRNSGPGVITLAAGSDDAINGGSDGGTLLLYSGDFALVQSGANWTVGVSMNAIKSMIEQSSTTTPITGTSLLYFKTDSNLYCKDDAGAEFLVGPLRDSITLEELSSTPSTPDSGDSKLYFKDDNLLYRLNDAGVEFAVDNSVAINSQTGTTYTVLTTDRGKMVTHNNASAIAVTLPQATSSFAPNGWNYVARNLGTGLVTITPTTSTIDGVSSISIVTGEGVLIASDGTNYFTQPGRIPFGQGASGYVIKSNGTSAAPTWQPGGKVLQAVSATTSILTSTATITPDNSVPTISEGVQIASVAITPSSTSSVIKLSFSSSFNGQNATSYIIVTAFRGTACIGSAFLTDDDINSLITGVISLDLIDSPSTTSSLTYSIRAGGTNGFSCNRINGSDLFGGTTALNRLILEELA